MQNSNTTYKFIEVVPYSGLVNWSVQYLKDSSISFNKKYPLVSISSFLKRNKTAIEIENDKEYKRATIKVRNGGVFLRDIEKGQNIGTKNQFLIKKGQFLLSKIDARNGAFGVVPAELEGGIITGNFWTFDVDYSKVNPHYLSLVATTPEFIKFSEQASNGTTNRHYLQEEAFLNIKIPLPSIEEQNRIVKSFQKKNESADNIENRIKEIEAEIKSHLNNSLGIEATEQITKKGLHFVSYTKAEKWGYEYLNRKVSLVKSKYRIEKIGKICSISSGGTPSRNNKEYYTGNVPWIKTAEVINDVIFDTEEKITEQAIENSSAKIYPKDSLIIAMYGQGATRGRTAKLGIDASTNQACAVLFNIKNDILLTDYVWVYLMNEYERLRSLASGNNQPNLNAGMIFNYTIQIPPLEIQKSIISFFFNKQSEIKELKQQAEQNRILALQEFENEIFKN